MIRYPAAANRRKIYNKSVFAQEEAQRELQNMVKRHAVTMLAHRLHPKHLWCRLVVRWKVEKPEPSLSGSGAEGIGAHDVILGDRAAAAHAKKTKKWSQRLWYTREDV